MGILKYNKKQCTNCKKFKTLSNFYYIKTTKKYHSWCKQCVINQIKENSNYETNYMSYNKKHKKDKHIWYIKNKEHHIKKGYEWREKNKEHYDAYIRSWMHKNKEKIYFKVKERERLKLRRGSHTLQEWKDLCKQSNFKCTCCGKKKKLTEDHIIPLSKGGSNSISNIQPLCQRCNSSKRTKIIDYRKK